MVGVKGKLCCIFIAQLLLAYSTASEDADAGNPLPKTTGMVNSTIASHNGSTDNTSLSANLTVSVTIDTTMEPKPKFPTIAIIVAVVVAVVILIIVIAVVVYKRQRRGRLITETEKKGVILEEGAVLDDTYQHTSTVEDDTEEYLIPEPSALSASRDQLKRSKASLRTSGSTSECVEDMYVNVETARNSNETETSNKDLYENVSDPILTRTSDPADEDYENTQMPYMNVPSTNGKGLPRSDSVDTTGDDYELFSP